MFKGAHLPSGKLTPWPVRHCMYAKEKKGVTKNVGAKKKFMTALFKRLEISALVRDIYNFTVNKEENCPLRIQLYTVLTQGISTIFTHRLPTAQAFTNVSTMLAL